MSLLKQLLLSVTVAILAILIGTLAFSIAAARQYLDGQLQSESENSASALALSLSQPGNQDAVTRELLMMALYDSGQFRLIRLASPDGQEIFARVRPAGGTGTALAPAWFSRWLPLSQPQAERAVSDGWRQVGQLTVAVDNGYARDALWRGSVQMATWVLGAGVTWSLFVLLLVRWFRRVLSEEVAAQVRAIANQAPEAPASSRHPHLTELSSVISAIRDTREVVRATAQEQSTRIESLELEVHRDPVTGLSNRKYFVNELRKALVGGDGQTVRQGYVLLARQRDLLALNAQMTRGSADEWLTTVGERLGRELAAQEPPAQGMQLARLNGSDFVVLMPGLEGPQAMQLVQRMRHALQSMRVVLASGQGCRWAYALTDYTEGSTVSDVMARLDQALMRAESAGHGDIEYVPYEANDAQRSSVGEGQWQGILAAALAAPQQLSLSIQAQTYAGATGDERVHEASLTLQVPGGPKMAGGLFLPVAVRLGLAADFDVRAIRLGLQWLAEHVQQTLVLRISLPSLARPDFLEQVQAALQAAPAPETLGRLILELDAHGVVASSEDVFAFCSAVQQCGAQLGLRRLDQEPLALTRLHALPLHYVKLGADVAEQAQRSPGLRHLLEAMFATAWDQGMRVYVSAAVEGEARLWLQAQGVGVPVVAA